MVPPVGSRRRLPQHLNVTSVLYRLDKDVRIKVACLPDGYHRAQPRRAGLTGQHLAGTGSRCSSSQRKPGQQTGLARLASRVGNRNCARRGKTCRGWNQVPRASREMRQSQRKPGYSTRAGVVGLSDLGHSRQEGGWVGDWIIEPSAVRILHLASWWWWVSVRKRHLQWWFACCLFRSAAFSRFSISMARYSTLCLVSSSRNRSRPRVALCRADEAIQVGPHRASGSPVGPLLHSTQQYRHGRSARVVRNSKGGLRE